MILMNLKVLIRYGAGILLFLTAGVIFLVSMPKNEDITVISLTSAREESADTSGDVDEYPDASGASVPAKSGSGGEIYKEGSRIEESPEAESPEAKSPEADGPAVKSTQTGGPEAGGPDGGQTAPKPTACSIWVHVCGEVMEPGVYELPEGTRIAEAILAAGGPTEDAVSEAVNQALKASDGQQIYLPSREEVSRAQAQNQGESGFSKIAGNAGTAGNGDAGSKNAGPNPDTGADNAKVNLNTADLAELMTLPGIGSAKAESIIAYRNVHGKFKTAGEIKNISGIKDSVFNQIKDRVTVE